MLRRIYVICLALSMISFVPRSHAQTGKSEIAVGYGYYSIYSFVYKGQNYGSHYTASSGSSCVNYRYYINKNVTIGLGIGYENINNWGSFLTFAPEVTVRYLDTRDDRVRVRLYGAFSFGLSVFDDQNVVAGNADQSGPKPWGFQATPFGIRVGRQFAWYAELGLGYKGLINTGLEVRFPRVLARHRHAE